MSHSTSKQTDAVNRLISLMATTPDQNELIIKVAADSQLLDVVKQLTGIQKNGEFPAPSSSFRLRTLCLAHGIPEEYAMQCLKLLATSLLAGESQPDYYGILDVEETATAEEIKKAYRKASLVYHPDHNPDDPSAHERFRAIHQAYEVLADPEHKAEYDQWRTFFSGFSTPSHTVSPSPGLASTNLNHKPARPFYRSFGFQIAMTVAFLLLLIFAIDFQNLLSTNRPASLTPDHSATALAPNSKREPTTAAQHVSTETRLEDRDRRQDSSTFAHLHQMELAQAPRKKPSHALIVEGWKTTNITPKTKVLPASSRDQTPESTLSDKPPTTEHEVVRLASSRPLTAVETKRTAMTAAAPTEPSVSADFDRSRDATPTSPHPSAPARTENPPIPSVGKGAETAQTSPATTPSTPATTRPASLPPARKAPQRPKAAPNLEQYPPEMQSVATGKHTPVDKVVTTSVHATVTQPVAPVVTETAAVPAPSKASSAPTPAASPTHDQDRSANKISEATVEPSQDHHQQPSPRVSSPAPAARQPAGRVKPSPVTRLASNSRKKGSPPIKTISLREIENRFLIFLNHYTDAFEKRDFSRFVSFFEPDATENGRPISSLYPRYRENFKRTTAIAYKITINRWSIDHQSNVRIIGRFTINATFKNSQNIKSSGSIKFLLKPHGKRFKVASLEYSFQ